MRPVPACRLATGLILVALSAAGCARSGADGQAGSPPPGQAPANPHAGVAGGLGDATGPNDGHAIALKATGISSAAEMTRDRARLDTQELRKDYEMAFRHAFSARFGQRNYPESIRLINKVITERPGFAPAYRVLGYALFNMNRATEALAAYQRAVSIDPDYGEAHYALAFLFAMGDPAVGREHFRRAMALGVPDERNLEQQFSPPNPQDK
jgi:tetratricopeptide (TPR) repeat protein